jgi:hypothetical protein
MDQPLTTRIREEHFASAAIHFNTMAEIVRFLHAAMGYPVLATLDKALKNGWVTGIPGLTRQTLHKHPSFSDATIKGHMAQARKNVRSTKKALQICDGKSDKITETSSQNQPKTNNTRSSESGEPASNPNGPDEMEPSTSISEIGDAHETDAEKRDDHEAGNDGTPNYCYGCVHRPRPTKRTYSDQTGEFVCELTSKNRYIYVMYDRESNHIFAEPIQSVSDAAITAAFKKCYEKLSRAGITPEMHMVDNQCGPLLKEAIESKGMELQVAPLGNHRANAAERAIRTFKEHFISILCGTDETFPLKLWDKLVPQAVLTLNLLRQSRINPKQSAHSQIHGPYDFNRTPIAPMGYRVLVHVKPDKRGTWDPKAEDGYYIGPAPNHYRCYKVYITDSEATRITDTITWVPGKVGIPSMSPSDEVIAAIGNVEKAMNNIPNENPLAIQKAQKLQALQQLSELFYPQSKDAGEMRVVAEGATENAGEMRVGDTHAPPFQLPPIVPNPVPPTPPPPPPPPPPTTYRQLTGHHGRKTRRSNRRKHIPAKMRENHATHTEFVHHIYKSIAETDAEYLACYGHAINPDVVTTGSWDDAIAPMRRQSTCDEYDLG